MWISSHSAWLRTSRKKARIGILIRLAGRDLDFHRGRFSLYQHVCHNGDHYQDSRPPRRVPQPRLGAVFFFFALIDLRLSIFVFLALAVCPLLEVLVFGVFSFLLMLSGSLFFFEL